MRIFCAVRHANDPRQYYGGLWSANFYPALRELGHEIVESKTDLLAASRFMNISDGFTREEMEVRARITEQIMDEVRAARRHRPIDLFLSYFYNAHFDPVGFDELRRLGIPSVNFYCNSIYQFGLVANIAAKVDFAWHAERDARAAYLAVGAKPVWVQMGADPKVYHPAVGVARQPRACFVGQRYADRDRWMADLVRACVPVDIYGPGWGAASDCTKSSAAFLGAASYLGRWSRKAGGVASYAEASSEAFKSEGPIYGLHRIFRQWAYRRGTRRLTPMFSASAKGAIPFHKIAEILSGYEVCLNFSNVWADGRPGSRLIPHIRLRDFEAPMSRACYLTGHTEEISEFYDIGKEIDTYSTKEELVDKTLFFLNHSMAAERLRNAGYLRATRDHTWARRFQQLMGKIGLGPSANSSP